MDFILEFNLRSCLPGEELLQNGECKQCEAGKYLLLPPESTTSCKDCPPSYQAECLGGN